MAAVSTGKSWGARKTTKKSWGVLKPNSNSTPQEDTRSQDLLDISQKYGLGEQAQAMLNPKPKLGVLGRLSKGLGAFNPAEAVLTGIEDKSVFSGIKKYASGVFKGIGSAITGTDYEGERRTFSDVAEKVGIKNKILKYGIGFAGDVFLDPSTYFGGALVKGITKGVKGGAEIGLKGLGKIAPKTEAGLRLAGEGLQEAVGKAFQFGYKTSTGAKGDVLGFMSRKQKSMLGLAASNLKRLGTGTLTKEQSEELALRMIAGKRAEFVAREAGDALAGDIAKKTTLEGASDTVKTVIEQQIQRSKKIGEQLGLENPYEVYFPFIKNDKIKKFITETSGLKVGSEGYRKQFKNLLTNENLEKNPAKVFFTRESQIVGDKMTRDFLQGFVGKYGKPLDAFKNSDEALKEGYQLIKEKGIFGKEIGYLNKYDTALIRDSLTPEFQSIDMLAKATGFDAATSLFKRSITGLFAPFHVRNYVSGMLQNYEVVGSAALNPKTIASAQKIAYLIGAGKKVPKEFQAFADRFAGDTFYNTDFLSAIDNAATQLKQVQPIFSKASFIETAKTLGLGNEAIPFRMARAVGQFIEHQQKLVAYIASRANGSNIDDALSIAEKSGFDYRALTRFESQVLRRLIPFYSFTRKNLELQLKTLGENPERISNIIKFFDNVGQGVTEDIPESEYNLLPEYVKNNFIIKTGASEDGKPKYALSGFGTPLEQFSQVLSDQPIRTLISQMNPILKVPLERALGKDFFRNKDLNEVTDAKEYQKLPDFLKDFIGFKQTEIKLKDGTTKTSYIGDPYRLHILRNLPTSRLFGYLYNIYNPDLTTGEKILNLTTGIKPQPIDLELQKYYQERDNREALEALLIRLKIIKKFTNTYEANKD